MGSTSQRAILGIIKGPGIPAVQMKRRFRDLEVCWRGRADIHRDPFRDQLRDLLLRSHMKNHEHGLTRGGKRLVRPDGLPVTRIR